MSERPTQAIDITQNGLIIGIHAFGGLTEKRPLVETFGALDYMDRIAKLIGRFVFRIMVKGTGESKNIPLHQVILYGGMPAQDGRTEAESWKGVIDQELATLVHEGDRYPYRVVEECTVCTTPTSLEGVIEYFFADWIASIQRNTTQGLSAPHPVFFTDHVRYKPTRALFDLWLRGKRMLGRDDKIVNFAQDFPVYTHDGVPLSGDRIVIPIDRHDVNMDGENGTVARNEKRYLQYLEELNAP